MNEQFEEGLLIGAIVCAGAFFAVLLGAQLRRRLRAKLEKWEQARNTAAMAARQVMDPAQRASLVRAAHDQIDLAEDIAHIAYRIEFKRQVRRNGNR